MDKIGRCHGLHVANSLIMLVHSAYGARFILSTRKQSGFRRILFWVSFGRQFLVVAFEHYHAVQVVLSSVLEQDRCVVSSTSEQVGDVLGGIFFQRQLWDVVDGGSRLVVYAWHAQQQGGRYARKEAAQIDCLHVQKELPVNMRNNQSPNSQTIPAKQNGIRTCAFRRTEILQGHKGRKEVYGL